MTSDNIYHEQLGKAITQAMNEATGDKALRHWAVIARTNPERTKINDYDVMPLKMALKENPEMMHGYARPSGSYAHALRYDPVRS